MLYNWEGYITVEQHDVLVEIEYEWIDSEPRVHGRTIDDAHPGFDPEVNILRITTQCDSELGIEICPESIDRETVTDNIINDHLETE